MTLSDLLKLESLIMGSAPFDSYDALQLCDAIVAKLKVHYFGEEKALEKFCEAYDKFTVALGRLDEGSATEQDEMAMAKDFLIAQSEEEILE